MAVRVQMAIGDAGYGHLRQMTDTTKEYSSYISGCRNIITTTVHTIYNRLVARVPGYTTEMYCVSCEVRTEFIYVM
jgi:hypothetical protein